jgi:signal transduction histidine kinase
MRLQGVAVTTHGAGWLLYAFAQLGMRRPRTIAFTLAATAVLAVAWLVPGCMITDQIVRFTIPWLHVSYKFQKTTPPGAVAFAAGCAVLLVPVVLYVRARKRMPEARTHAVGLSLIIACGIHDIVASELPLPLPFVLPVGFLVAIGFVGFSLASAFVEGARALDHLTTKLEHLVEERSSKLVAVEAALARAEKLVAIGKLSAGVAHEINNPAAAIAANLDYLRTELARGKVPADVLECLDDSTAAVQLIAKVVRQLLDTARSGTSGSTGSASVERAIDQALATVRPQLAGRVVVEVDADAGLFARGDETSLVQVLVNLLVNGAQAIPKTQQHAVVRVRARERDGRIAVEVNDNGSGIPDDVRARLFEPFFTTKPLGEGTGLGLSVTLGLVRSMGGEIEVESRPGDTTMRVLVPTSKRAPRACLEAKSVVAIS